MDTNNTAYYNTRIENIYSDKYIHKLILKLTPAGNIHGSEQ